MKNLVYVAIMAVIVLCLWHMLNKDGRASRAVENAVENASLSLEENSLTLQPIVIRKSMLEQRERDNREWTADNINKHPDPQGEREKYVLAFNDTMLKIWQEQITLLGVIDTGNLLNSVNALPVRADGRFIEIGLTQSFLEYGLWQDFGTGKEIPRGNHGDIGREKKRVAKKWFSKKYYSSVLNLRDFLADNIGQSFVGVVAKALDDNYRRYNH